MRLKREREAIRRPQLSRTPQDLGLLLQKEFVGMLREPACLIPVPPVGFSPVAFLLRKPLRKETSFRSLSRAPLIPEPHESLLWVHSCYLAGRPCEDGGHHSWHQQPLNPALEPPPGGLGSAQIGAGRGRQDGSRTADCTVRSLESNRGTDGFWVGLGSKSS